MSDVSNALLELRDVGIPELPEPGDAGDRRVRTVWEREIASGRRPRFVWMRRKIMIRGFGITPALLFAVVASAAAAATGAIVAVNATTIFQKNPQQQERDRSGTIPDLQTVLPYSVRMVGSVSVPDYGTVQFWGAKTKQRGFCWALKLPNGTWGDYPRSLHPSGGWIGGTVPGCTETRQQQVVIGGAVRPGQQPTGPEPTPLEELTNSVKNRAGHQWDIYFGYVEVQGTAATVRDSVTGISTKVTSDGYYALAEPTPRCGQIPAIASEIGKGGITAHTLCPGFDTLQVLSASGQQLKPDYTCGKLLPGYKLGPTSG